MKFSTYDQDNDHASGIDCSSIRGSVGWWFRDGTLGTLLTGKYEFIDSLLSRYREIRWFSNDQPEFVEMKIKRNV